MNRRALLAAVLTLAGCGEGATHPPLHTAVVCDGESESACPSAERVALFDTWASAAMRRPGSTFAVWVVPAEGKPRQTMTACVPASWGPGVMEAKAAFLRNGRERAGRDGPGTAQGCALTRDLDGEVHVIGEGRRLRLEGGHAPLHLAVVCDRSDSMLGVACDGDALRSEYGSWLERSGAAPGSTFTVYGVGVSRDSTQRLVDVNAEKVSAGQRVAGLIATQRSLGDPLRGAPTGSAIAEAVSVAASSLREAPGRHELLLLSDLRQVTLRVWNFEVAAPAPEAFASWLRKSGLAPDLRGVEVRACGVHHRRAPGAPPFDAALARRVEQAWRRALADTGAKATRLDGGCARAGQRHRALQDLRDPS